MNLKNLLINNVWYDIEYNGSKSIKSNVKCPSEYNTFQSDAIETQFITTCIQNKEIYRGKVFILTMEVQKDIFNVGIKKEHEKDTLWIYDYDDITPELTFIILGKYDQSIMKIISPNILFSTIPNLITGLRNMYFLGEYHFKYSYKELYGKNLY